VPLESGPQAVAVNASGDRIYATMPSVDKVAVLNRSLNVVATIAVDDFPIGVAVSP
jgi:DNA-binding beta-propeller fold protein YncE